MAEETESGPLITPAEVGKDDREGEKAEEGDASRAGVEETVETGERKEDDRPPKSEENSVGPTADDSESPLASDEEWEEVEVDVSGSEYETVTESEGDEEEEEGSAGRGAEAEEKQRMRTERDS